MRRHFMTVHPGISMYVDREGAAPYPVCPNCRMHITAPLHAHLATKACAVAGNRFRNRQRSGDLAAVATQRFLIDETVLEVVPSFRYLGRIMTATDSDLLAVRTNLLKAKAQWGKIARVLCHSGVPPRVMGYFYKTIVQAVLLYGSETWALSRRMLKLLESFHHHCARCLTGRHIRPITSPQGITTWEYPDTATTLELAGLETMTTYIKRRRATIWRNFAKDRELVKSCKALPPVTGQQIGWCSQQMH